VWGVSAVVIGWNPGGTADAIRSTERAAAHRHPRAQPPSLAP